MQDVDLYVRTKAINGARGARAPTTTKSAAADRALRACRPPQSQSARRHASCSSTPLAIATLCAGWRLRVSPTRRRARSLCCSLCCWGSAGAAASPRAAHCCLSPGASLLRSRRHLRRLRRHLDSVRVCSGDGRVVGGRRVGKGGARGGAGFAGTGVGSATHGSTT